MFIKYIYTNNSTLADPIHLRTLNIAKTQFGACCIQLYKVCPLNKKLHAQSLRVLWSYSSLVTSKSNDILLKKDEGWVGVIFCIVCFDLTHHWSCDNLIRYLYETPNETSFDDINLNTCATYYCLLTRCRLDSWDAVFPGSWFSHVHNINYSASCTILAAIILAAIATSSSVRWAQNDMSELW